jgi:hypothetical protein
MTDQEDDSILKIFYDWAEIELGRPINKTPISEGGMWVPDLPAISQRGGEEYATLHRYWLGLVKGFKNFDEYAEQIHLRADYALADCKYALRKYDKTLQGFEMRLCWWNVVSLLRAVGHVLSKVDADVSPEHKRVILEEFEKIKKSKPEPRIFWSFIEPERNNFLKEYRYNIIRTMDIGNNLAIDLGSLQGVSFSSPTAEIKSSIIDGPFRGQNELDVAQEAVKWWENYLENIKKRISEERP